MTLDYPESLVDTGGAISSPFSRQLIDEHSKDRSGQALIAFGTPSTAARLVIQQGHLRARYGIGCDGFCPGWDVMNTVKI
jgi:hypothetical protein